MGTTSEKLTYLNGTKQKLKQAINNIGGEVTDETTFRNYVAELENAYDRLPKTEFEEDESVTLENTLKGKLDFDDGKVGIGQSSQDSTQGYNFANLNGMNDTTNNGVTFTINKENGLTKSVKINGTSVNYDSYCIGTAYLLPAGTYVVYGNGVTNNIITQIVNDTQTAQLGYSGKDDNTMTLEQDTNIIIRLRVTVGATINNVEVKPIIATTSGKSFEPYTGGYSSPSPNWEQEIKCVAGRNKLPTYEIKKFTASADAWCSLDGINNFYNQTNIAPSKVFCNLKANQTYTISVYQKANTNNVQLVDYTGTVLLTGIETQAKQYTPSTDIKVYPRLKVTSSNTETYCYMQIEEGTQATPYLPYNTIEETISGKNEYDVTTNNFVERCTLSEGIFTANSLDNRNITFGYTTNKFTILNGETYYFSVDIKLKSGTASKLGLIRFSNAGFSVSAITNPNLTSSFQRYSFSATNTSGETISASKILMQLSSTDFSSPSIEFKNVLVSKLSDTTYEPYKTPKTYQFSLGDHKFYGIGTYRDYILRTTGKNLLNPSRYLHAVVNATIGSTGTLSEWATSWTTWIEMKPNQTYVFSGNLSNVNSNVARAFVTNSEVAIGTSVTRVDNLSNGTTYTNTGGYKYLVLEFLDVTSYQGNWQIEEGSTASDYQPYGVGNWYKVGKIGETIYTGASDENWAIWQGIILIDDTTIKNLGTSNSNFYLNYFRNVLSIAYIGSNTGQRLHIRLSNAGLSEITSVSAWKTWLSTHNLDFIYICNETYTPITGTLAEQLEAWWNGQSLDGTTIIEGNGDLPMIIKCRGLKGE